ncbi:MAG: RecX family transcriptional regulator [Bacteroidia bacterium]|nr:RecX family transcriptional regulator [Bacteroidia bacterium]
MIDKVILDKISSYIEYRYRSLHETKLKLRQLKLSDAEQTEIIAYLLEKGFLDEDKFITAFVRGKFFHKYWGKQKIRYGLSYHQVSQEIVEKIISREISSEDYERTILRLISKKIGGQNPSELTQLKKYQVSQYLISHGFSYEEFTKYLS